MRKLIYIIFCLCILTISHSCNDNQMDEIKTPEELYEDSLDLRMEQMDRAQLLNNLCEIDTSTTNSISYIPRHGKVLNETTPTVRYIGVESLEEAKNYFKMSIALPPQEDADNWRFTDFVEIADCRLEFTESQTSDEIARLAIDCPELKNVMTELVFIPRSLWPENDASSPFQYGSVWMKDNGFIWNKIVYICVRPCGYGQKGIMLTFDSGWGSILYNECILQGVFNLYSNCASYDAINAFTSFVNDSPNKFKAAYDAIIDHYTNSSRSPVLIEPTLLLSLYSKTYNILKKVDEKNTVHFNIGSPNPSNPKDAKHFWLRMLDFYYLVNVKYFSMIYNSDKGHYDKKLWAENYKEAETPRNEIPSYSFEFDYDNYPKDLIKIGK